MVRANFSVSNFVVQLQDIWNSEGRDFLDLKIDETNTWPHFSMIGKREGTPVISGHFVEGGTSFWQVSNAGRETFTGNDRSCAEFMNDIRTVVGVLVLKGCTETVWIDHAGLLVIAMVTIEIDSRSIIFGGTPAFWKRGLIEKSIEYSPYRSLRRPE